MASAPAAVRSTCWPVEQSICWHGLVAITVGVAVFSPVALGGRGVVASGLPCVLLAMATLTNSRACGALGPRDFLTLAGSLSMVSDYGHGE